MTGQYADQAAFYRAALLLGLVRGEPVVAWADTVIASDPQAPPAFAELATTDVNDLTLLRERLWILAGEQESAVVIRPLIGLVHRDLESGRRSLPDTMTVLKQLRAFIRVDATLNEQVKTLGLDIAIAAPGSQQRADAEQRVRDWLAQYA